MELKRVTIKDNEEFLRKISSPVDFSTKDYLESIEKLDYFCKNDNLCMAMASIQLGIPLRIIYLKKTDLNRLDEDYNESRVLINPIIKKSRGLTRYWEACMSYLNNTCLVERPYEIDLEYYDKNGEKHFETFTGFVATVLSHEIDHLDGILHMDIALKKLEKTPEERKILREKEPYTIIRKDGEYIHPKLEK